MSNIAATPAARRFGRVAGPMLAGLMIALPTLEGLSTAGWQVAALGAVMAIWWMTEALPLFLVPAAMVALDVLALGRWVFGDF